MYPEATVKSAPDTVMIVPLGSLIDRRDSSGMKKSFSTSVGKVSISTVDPKLYSLGRAKLSHPCNSLSEIVRFNPRLSDIVKFNGGGSSSSTTTSTAGLSLTSKSI